MNKIITIIFALCIMIPITYAIDDLPSIQQRMQNKFIPQNQGPPTEEEQENLITCQEKIDRYTLKVNKYADKTNLDDFQQWKKKYYNSRLKWWKEYCAE